MLDIFENVKICGSGCWEWQGPFCADKRYGRVVGMPKLVMAHRMVFQMFKGILEHGKVVMHSCDNGICINPEHLSQGTAKDNSDDMVKKGRHNNLFKSGEQSGEDNASSKLTIEIVEKIREYHSTKKCSYRQLALEFNLPSKGHAHAIVKRIIWK